ncbi:MAG: tRNA lysidine(34) synthetase TilS [Acutalibacteraceae bacterium]|nr:tRNA lysidine(34) synthetase TilS [Acutalibacteraceae bacterium]
MLSKILKAVNDYNLIEKGDNICVALSGGADSVALLKGLIQLKQTLLINQITAVHINHCLRGRESDNDEQFCVNLCNGMNIPITVKRVDVSKMKGSVELNARVVRYQVFDEIISEGFKIATAHTKSDNLETVIFNMARGSSISGLCGIPPKRDNYIRPLIYCGKEETEQFAENFVVDLSNLSDEYNRNHIRHNIVPSLKKINSQVENSVLNMSNSLREIDAFLNQSAENQIEKIKTHNGYDTEKIKSMPTALAKRVLLIISKNEINVNLDSFHLNSLYASLFNGARLQLNNNCFANICKGKLTFENAKNFKFFKIELEKTQEVNNLLINCTADCDKITGEVIIRTRQPGDRIKLKGRPEKTLKKLFNEIALPLSQRDNLPVLADGKGVIFVPFVGVAERVAVDKNSKNLLKATVVENE